MVKQNPAHRAQAPQVLTLTCRVPMRLYSRINELPVEAREGYELVAVTHTALPEHTYGLVFENGDV